MGSQIDRRIPLTGLTADAFQGIDTDFLVRGKGVDSLQDLFFLGPDLTTGTGVRGSGSGDSATRFFPVTVPRDTAKGVYPVFLEKAVNVFVSNEPELGVISGALEVFDPLRFGQAFAQFAHLPGASVSGISLINTNLKQPANGRLSARNGAGERQEVTLGSLQQDANGDYPVSLAPGGSLSAQSSGDAAFLGSFRARADRGFGGTVLFEGPFGTTGVGASPPLYSFVAPVEIRGGGTTNTALAITNLDDRPVQILVRVQNKVGRIQGSNTIELGGNAQLARFIREADDAQSLLPGLPDDFQGTVLVTSNRQIGATVIRLAPGVFTTFPVIQKRVSTSSFYAQFVHAGDLTSTLLLVNPSPLATALVFVQVRDSKGGGAWVSLNGEVLPGGAKLVSIPPLGCTTLETGGEQSLVGSVEVFSLVPEGWSSSAPQRWGQLEWERAFRREIWWFLSRGMRRPTSIWELLWWKPRVGR